MTDAAVDGPGGQVAASSVAPKVDPETLAIRTRPARAIRIKRGAVIALSALAMIFVMFAAWAALKHGGVPKLVAQDQPDLSTSAAGDSLNGLPKTYSDVPKLGRPLPGDLGKPMLDQQQKASEPGMADRLGSAQAEASARQQQRAETKAALQSGLMVNAAAGSQVVAASATPSAAATADPAIDSKSGLALDPERDPNGQGHKADFVATLPKDGTVNPHQLSPSPSPYVLSAGSVIAASLITGLRSDLPGLVAAQVTEDVYDSPTGRTLLVPQGSRLVGKYDSVVAFGQKRALVVWQRVILPDGSSVSLDNMPAADPAGYAGLQDRVDYHTWSLLKGVAISTLLGIGSDLQFSGNGGLVEAIRQSATQNVSRAGDQLTAKALDIQPTITIRPGAPVRLLVDRDLVLKPWKGDR
ncbi:conjugal transfer protein TrbI [Nostoc sp. 3335mG]|nr:conjugal transfer protein TrbI [Nostoc sp. 3335mG]